MDEGSCLLLVNDKEWGVGCKYKNWVIKYFKFIIMFLKNNNKEF